MRLDHRGGEVTLSLAGHMLLRHSPTAPCLAAGHGEARIDMYRGNFDIEDHLAARTELTHASLTGNRLAFAPAPGAEPWVVFAAEGDARAATLRLLHSRPGLNRLWLRLVAEPAEQVWGGGEQMSYFNLRGRRFPLWTSEPGVGRDKTTALTRRADAESHAGGDYYTTNYPQPTFLSSRRLAVHVDTTAYSVFDFRNESFHEIETWAIPDRIEFRLADSLAELVSAMADRFGRQPPLPAWLDRGAIIGLKQGAASFTRLDRILDAGAAVSALWCEDWAGVRQTSFGTRLFWDWRWNPARYPDLPGRIADLAARGIRFMGYVNPYLAVDGTLFPQAEAAGLLARDAAGETYRVDFGEFDAGVLDFTQGAAGAWFAETILKRNMLDLGMAGWMADFGEYLPTDAHLAAGDALLAHNAWPVLWAEVNARAIAAAGLRGQALFFMRAGFTGIQRHCPLLWAGDQSVDFSRHDGIGTVICGALSAGMLGNAFHHSDIGGYTSLYGNVRSPELLMRWTELAAFTPVMRTHEGNRPADNLQIDHDAAVLDHFARFTRLWRALVPYLRRLVAEAGRTGLPAQRPLFLHFPHDPASFTIQDQYLYGPDLLVAPVITAGLTPAMVTRDRYLPAGTGWTDLWSRRHWPGGQRISIAAPLGRPPVFVRDGTPHAALFAAAAAEVTG